MKSVVELVVFGVLLNITLAPLVLEIAGNLDYYSSTIRYHTKSLLEKNDPNAVAWYRQHIRTSGTVYWHGPVSQRIWAEERPGEPFPTALAFRWQGAAACLFAVGVIVLGIVAHHTCEQK